MSGPDQSPFVLHGLDGNDVVFPGESRIEIRSSGDGKPPSEDILRGTSGPHTWARKDGGPWRKVAGMDRWDAAEEAVKFPDADAAMERLCGKEGNG